MVENYSNVPIAVNTAELLCEDPYNWREGFFGSSGSGLSAGGAVSIVIVLFAIAAGVMTFFFLRKKKEFDAHDAKLAEEKMNK